MANWWDIVPLDGCFAAQFLYRSQRKFMHVLFPALDNGPLTGADLVQAVAKTNVASFEKQVYQMDFLGSTYN
jgi:hypothetical protein